MWKKLISMAMVTLAFLLLFLFSGCGNVGQEAYFHKVRELNEKLASRLGNLSEETANLHKGDEQETEEKLAEILEEMAQVLEEGAQDMGNIKVPAGGEEAHVALLKLLSEVASGYRGAATALVPHGVEGDEEHGNVKEKSPEEGVDQPHGEGLEEDHPSSTPGAETNPPDRH